MNDTRHQMLRSPRLKMLFLSFLIIAVVGLDIGLVGGIFIATGNKFIDPLSTTHRETNPRGDATACVISPSPDTCREDVSPFGTEQPGMASCTEQASVKALIRLTDPSVIEASLATLQVWWSPLCRSWFAKVSPSLILFGRYSLSVSVARPHSSVPWIYQMRETTIRREHEEKHVQAWTSLLYSPTETPVETCLEIRQKHKTYRTCTTSE